MSEEEFDESSSDDESEADSYASEDSEGSDEMSDSGEDWDDLEENARQGNNIFFTPQNQRLTYN